MKKSKIEASVVIPSYNHVRYVRTILNSLQTQKTSYGFEVIVVDSGTDDTEQVIKTDYPWVRLIKLKQRTHPGEARNVGVAAARSDVILFTDVDCRVSPEWIEFLLSKQTKEFRIVTGPVKNGTPYHVIGTADYLLEFYDSLNAKDGVKCGPVGTVNVCYPRALLKKYGPLDGFVKGSDSRFSRKLLENGEKIFYHKAARVWHYNRTHLVKVFTNQYLLGLGAARTTKQYATMGSLLIKHPVLILFMPFFRSLRIGWILLRKSPWDFLRFVVLYPLVFIGLCCHAAGFFKGICNER